jgi:hypothetical protein
MTIDELNKAVEELDRDITDLVVLRDSLRALQTLSDQMDEATLSSMADSILSKVSSKSLNLPNVKIRAESRLLVKDE